MSIKLDIEEFIQGYMEKCPPPFVLDENSVPLYIIDITDIYDEQEITNPN